MAPSRRKGVVKAAAAAATAATTRREWKVGDLVLAKVKGFPAWPATVDEPEKWGYPADRKKVLVHFFGTQQIGFCSPADVEEFTEEIKSSLLGKRHGKGADFVRAVNEIIISFEKLKKREQVISANETTEIIINNENKSEESLTKCVTNEDSVVSAEPQLLCTGASNNLNSLTEAAAAAAEDALRDAEMQLDEARLSTETPACTTYSTRSKTEITQPQNSVTQGRVSARRLRSSSKTDAKGPQNIALPSLNKSRRFKNSGTNASKDRSLRRSARIMKSSDDSEGYGADSPASVSNDSIEENESEVMTVDSDSPCFNNGSTVESHCKPVVVNQFRENNNEEEIELNNRPDFQTSTAIIKKKRGLNRKRHSDDVVGESNSNAFVSDSEVRKGSVSPTNIEKLAERSAREDGDEHLPLFKRARIRLERSAAAEKKEGIIAHKGEKILEVSERHATQISGTLNCKVDDSGDVESVPIEVDSASVPFSPASPKKAQSWEGGKNLWETKNFVDGEAALPPSKRLHRALEAMSANVAEDNQTTPNFPLKVNTKSNGDIPSVAECSEFSIGNKAVIELVSAPAENYSNDDSNFDSSDCCTMSNSETLLIDSKTYTTVSDYVRSYSTNSLNPELCKDSTAQTEGADFKCLKESSLELDSKHVKLDPQNIGEDYLDQSAPCFNVSLTNVCKIEFSELDATVKGSGPDVSQVSLEVLTLKENAGSELNYDSNVELDNCVIEGDISHGVKGLSLAKNNHDSHKSEVEKERSPVSKFLNRVPSGSPVKVLTKGHHLCLSNSIPISDERLEYFAVNQSRHLFAKTSPRSSSMGNVTTSDNNYLENRSSCSPDVQLNSEKAKLAGKSNCKGEETLASFEGTIRSLTGTKESIGRATRVAIDCAKYGFAIKVVEILTQNLERESNSHKKVDLFFLVDSIAQCSRGMKGDGGIYPSVIQAVLPRLLLAAAPPGSSSLENHRQCLKVLRVWQERKILPEPIIHHHIRELDSLCFSYPKAGSRRPLRNERAFDDPIREMEGMMVDEYGSNSSFQLPGFCMPRMLREDDVGSDSDGESFEAVTPEHNVENLDGERALIPTVEKRSLILENVDGELEMEDVAPYREEEISSTSNLTKDHMQLSHHHCDNSYGPPITSQKPKSVPLACANLPRSPLNPPPPPPPPPPYPLPPSSFPHTMVDSTANGPTSNIYPSLQNFDKNLPGCVAKQTGLPRMKSTNLDSMHHRARDNKDFEAQVPRHMPDNINTCSFNDRPASHFSAQGSNRIQPGESGFNKGLHVRPPHPAPSNQFSYPQQRQIQSRRDLPPPSHPNRFHMRNEESSNFYRDRDRNKFVPRDNIGECWRPPLPPISGQCYRNGTRVSHGHMSYSGPPRESSTNSRWNFPPRPPNHRQLNPYREPEGPIPVGNRGPNYWRPR